MARTGGASARVQRLSRPDAQVSSGCGPFGRFILRAAYFCIAPCCNRCKCLQPQPEFLRFARITEWWRAFVNRKTEAGNFSPPLWPEQQVCYFKPNWRSKNRSSLLESISKRN